MAGWLAAYLPYHTQGITPSTTLSAIFPYCSWRISKHSHCTCVWKEGGFYFKEEKVPFFWLWGLKLTTPVDQWLSVWKERKGGKCWTLPSMLREGRADLWLIYNGLGKSVLTGLATILTCCFIHSYNTVITRILNLYRLLTLYMPGTILNALPVLTIYSSHNPKDVGSIITHTSQMWKPKHRD